MNMSFSIKNKFTSDCTKYNFNIYEHSLTLKELDDYILKILYDKDKLNHLFQLKNTLSRRDRILQLRVFIENDFFNREQEVDDEEIRTYIANKSTETYYSFFAEALLARLNIDYVDSNLISGVIAINDNIKTVSTGADVCMFSQENLILGEAKFYSSLNGGVHSIIKDESIVSKLDHYFTNIFTADSELILKGIDGDIRNMTTSKIKELPLVLSGFVLHTKNKTSKYSRTYNLVNKISITNFPEHYKVHLYHLPIESKEELIFKAQRKALDLIIRLKEL